MSSYAVLALLLATVLVVVADRPKYTGKYDNVDVDGILSNNRILTNYIKCLMEEGPCTPEGRELKKTLPDALRTGCEKCNEKQRNTAERVIRHLMKERSTDWERLVRKYDSTGEYKRRYAQVAKEVFSKP